jgi:hypothetical protein
MELGAILYICAALREARFLGLNMFIENLVRPLKALKAIGLKGAACINQHMPKDDFIYR